MANNCLYRMHAVAKNENALKRLVAIMNYRDAEYFIYRCFSAMVENTYEEDGKFVYEIDGDVAWSCARWFENKEDFDSILAENGTAHCITLDLLCKRLGIAIELYSEECGNGFQEWYRCNHKGELTANESCDWMLTMEDEDGNELDEPIEEGGFGGDYCVFGKANEIWG